MSVDVTPKSRGATKAVEAQRRAEAHVVVRAWFDQLKASTKDRDAEFMIEVFRIAVRTIGAVLVQWAGQSRATGVLAGALTKINPAWKSDTTKAREEAEAVFGNAA